LGIAMFPSASADCKLRRSLSPSGFGWSLRSVEIEQKHNFIFKQVFLTFLRFRL
jgi:hypothetical protein